jgi:hypothetical protein
VTVHQGDVLDVLRTLPGGSVNCVVTSPPYFGLRNYGVEQTDWPAVEFVPVAGLPPMTITPMRCCLGLESDPWAYVAHLVLIARTMRRLVRDDGVLWLNLGDSYSTRKIVRDSSHQPGMHADRIDHATIGKSWRDNAADGNSRMPTQTGLPEKNLLGIPERVTLALQADGWIWRNKVVWHKLTAMPEPVTDRLSCRWEPMYLFSKSRRYEFDLDAIREPLTHPDAADGTRVFGGRNKADALTTGSSARRTGNTYGRPQKARAIELARQKGLTPEHLDAIRAVGMSDTGKAAAQQTGAGHNRPEVQALADEAKAALGGYYREFLTPQGKNPGDVWSLPMQPFAGAHFATMPPALARRCILAGCPEDGTVLDPFAGSGTTLMVARALGRKSVGIELNPDYIDIIRGRIGQEPLDFGTAS